MGKRGRNEFLEEKRMDGWSALGNELREERG